MRFCRAPRSSKMGLAAGGAGRSVVALRPHGSESSATNAADLGCGSSGLVRIPTRGLRGWGKGRILAVEGSRMYVKAAAEGGRDGGEAVLQKKADCVNGLPKMSNVGNSSNILWHKCSVEKADREQLLRQKGCVIWVTGLSGSGLCLGFFALA
uniref:Uncharacterized protein n=1 Tax=Kalanchoe fedtschenkoi TaxID=63787 RepID=A0A7N0ZRW1_KALFE